MRAPLLTLTLCTFAAPALAADYPATLDWAEVATIATPLSGRIAQVRADVGDRVVKGTVLASLDSRGYDAELKRAEAELKGLHATFAETEREYTRAKELYERTVLSTTELQQAEVAFNAGQAQLRRAEASVALARLNLEYSQIRAPFDGIVIERRVHPGETVANQFQVTPMLRVASSDHWIARAWVDAAAIARLKRGETVSVKALDRALTGTVRAIGLASRVEANGEVAIAVDISVETTGEPALAPGLPATVTLP